MQRAGNPLHDVFYAHSSLTRDLHTDVGLKKSEPRQREHPAINERSTNVQLVKSVELESQGEVCAIRMLNDGDRLARKLHQVAG